MVKQRFLWGLVALTVLVGAAAASPPSTAEPPEPTTIPTPPVPECKIDGFGWSANVQKRGWWIFSDYWAVGNMSASAGCNVSTELELVGSIDAAHGTKAVDGDAGFKSSASVSACCAEQPYFGPGHQHFFTAAAELQYAGAPGADAKEKVFWI